jgi:hypothetical protein
MECDGCGAALEPTDLACRYCRRATPFAAQHQAAAREREAKAAAEQAAGVARQQVTAQSELQKASTRALVFALLGSLTCLLPVFSVLSVVSFFRARKIARQLSVDLPAKATLGGILSVFWIVTSPVFLVWAFVRDSALQERADRRILALEAQIAAPAQAPVLDGVTACALAELHALKTGYSGTKGKDLGHFDCPGAMSGSAAHPVLGRISFGTEHDNTRYSVAACFDRGTRWFVKELNAAHTCPP